MKLYKKIGVILTIILIVVITIGVLSDLITFGYGLGDLLMLGFIVVCTIIIYSFYRLTLIPNKKIVRNILDIILLIGILLFIIYLILSITVWRGVEKPWDGNILIN